MRRAATTRAWSARARRGSTNRVIAFTLDDTQSSLLRIPRSREWGRKFRRSFRGFDQSNGHIVGCACRAPGAGSRVHICGQQLAPSKSGQQFLPLNRCVRWADIQIIPPCRPNGHPCSMAKTADQTFSVLKHSQVCALHAHYLRRSVPCVWGSIRLVELWVSVTVKCVPNGHILSTENNAGVQFLASTIPLGPPPTC